RHNARAAEITLAIIAESARWGASKVSTPFNRNHWLTAVNSVNNQIAQRTAIVINQFRNTRIIHPTTGPLAPLFPSIDAPLMSQFGGEIDPSDQLSLSKPSGSPGSAVIYYTLDGSDPRLVGGGLSPTAILYNGPFSLNLGTQVKARILNGSAWSAAVTATFDVLHAADFSFDFVDQTYQQNFNSFVGTESTVPPHFTVQAGGASVFRTVFDARTDSAGDFTGIMAATSDGQNYSLAWRESTGPANLDDARILFTFTNNTGVPLTGFDVSYDVEAWVNGRRDNQIRFKFDVYPDSSSAQAAEGRNAFETDIFATPNPNHTPIASNNAQFVLDGKDLANRTTVSGHVDLRTLLVDESDPAKGVFGELLPGQTAYFRWQISNGNLTDGNRSALGIDNISITARVESSVESADFNGDGFVDGLDFLTWQRGLGTVNASPADGDANGDGQVNGADLVIWQNQFGQPAPTTAMASRTSSDESPQFSAMTAEESAMPRSALHIPPSLVSAEASTAAEPLSIVWLAMQEEDSDASEQLAETSQLPNVYDVDSAFAQAGPAITSSLEDDDWFEGYVADESAEIADDLIAELAWTAFDSMLEG
ncbi:MAG TPA: dockerin type I domain-containing protein, partial [Lacipirellulaceae bacterium]|nr:dockerin type I domain-containing protein [Lacipirellulaceae bacterium]